MDSVWTKPQQNLAEEILQKTLAFGADLAGLAAVSELKNCPSERLFPNMKDHSRDHFAERITTGLPHGAVKWEANEQTLLVFAVNHPEAAPQMDWWYGSINPPGNQILADIAKRLKAYLAEVHPEIQVYPKPYHVEKGGVYLKDAAVAAGLGCIGKNNLLLTPSFGPAVRLRAVGLSIALPPSPKLEFDPCSGCSAPCRSACPRQAYATPVYTPQESGSMPLPAQDGSYYRQLCVYEMEANEQTAATELHPEISPEPVPVIRYCRACEQNCSLMTR